MVCKYEKFIDKLLIGKLSEDNLIQLKEHAIDCEDCSNKLKQIEVTDVIIKNELSNFPYTSNKNEIMDAINHRKFNIHIQSLLYKSRKYVYGIAAILAIVVSIHIVKPFINVVKTNIEKNNVKPASSDIDTPKNITNNNTNSNTSNNTTNNTTSTIDVHNLRFTLPENWSTKINEYNVVIFYENNKQKGGLDIATISSSMTLIQNMAPNNSQIISQEDIDTQLGKGKFAIFEISSSAASTTQYKTYEMDAMIPIHDDQSYRISFSSTKKFSNEDKNVFINLLKQIRYTSNDIHNLKFILPSNWSSKINEYNAVTFYENGKEKGGLLIARINENGTLVQNMSPNHSEVISQEDINTQLGKGKLAIFEISSPAAAATPYTTYEMDAMIPINDDQAYSSSFSSTKKFSNEDKDVFINILKQMHY